MNVAFEQADERIYRKMYRSSDGHCQFGSYTVKFQLLDTDVMIWKTFFVHNF